MNDDTEQLSEAFVAHEHLAPDAADVLLKARGIARSYQRRRWAVRATGGAVLAGGLVAGGIALPGRAGGHAAPQRPTTLTFGAQPSDSSSPSPSPSTAAGTTATASYTQQDELDAFFNAGYDYNDAQALAQAWGSSDGIVAIKAEAGLKLLEGDQLPVPPSGTPATKEEINQGAFFDAGYDYADAQTLAADWNETNLDQVKAEAGAKLLAGETLPIQPSGDKTVLITGSGGVSGTPVVQTKEDKARAEFFAEGYGYDDAVKLEQYFNESDPWQVKATAGQKLLDGGTLPYAPIAP